MVNAKPAVFESYDVGDYVGLQAPNFQWGGFDGVVRILARNFDARTGDVALIIEEQYQDYILEAFEESLKSLTASRHSLADGNVGLRGCLILAYPPSNGKACNQHPQPIQGGNDAHFGTVEQGEGNHNR